MKKNNTDDLVVLTDESGRPVHFEYLDLIEYNEIEYAVLFPLDNDSNEVAILRVDYFDGEEEQLSGVDDEEILEAVFKLFMERYNEE